MVALRGSVVTERFRFDGGRRATAYVPRAATDSVVFAVDGGWHLDRLARALEAAVPEPSTLIVGVPGRNDDDGRLREYVEAFGGPEFEAFERFLIDEVRGWASAELGAALAPERTAVWGASVGGELALAQGLRHPEIFGTVLCASPGGGFTPAGSLPRLEGTRAYLVGGRQEVWFFANAVAWAGALGDAGADVVIEQRDGEHGGRFWFDELPRMVSWAFDG